VLRNNFVALVFCNCVSSFVLDLFIFILPHLDGNPYLTGASVSTFQTLAYLTSSLLLRLLGVKLQIFLCYLLPFATALTYLLRLHLATLSPLENAVMLGLTLFGLAANYNSTLYGAYRVAPPGYAGTFFVLMNLFKVGLVSLTPVIADVQQGSQELMMQGFALLSMVSSGMAWVLIKID
jgi:hypothetical protein